MDKRELIQKALELKKKGEFERSLRIIREALTYISDSQELKTLLITILFDYASMLMDDWIVDYNKTLSCYQEITEIDPTNYRALYNMGISLFSLGKHDEALIRFDEALKLKPDYKYCYYNIGLVYEEKGMLQKAYDAYKNALEIDPHFGYAKEGKKSVEMKLETLSATEERVPSGEQLEQLKSLLRVSKKVNLKDLQNILQMDRTHLLTLVIGWAEKYGFEIDGDYLIINKKNLSQFFDNMNAEEV